MINIKLDKNTLYIGLLILNRILETILLHANKWALACLKNITYKLFAYKPYVWIGFSIK